MALVAAALLGVACSGGSTGDEGAETTTTSTIPTTTTTIPIDPEADEAAARAALLTADDMPGWSELDDDGAEDDAGSGEGEGQGEGKGKKAGTFFDRLAECAGVAAPPVAHAAASNPGFRSPRGEMVVADVGFTADPDEATALLDLFRHEEMPDCYARLYRERMVENRDARGLAGEIGTPVFQETPVDALGDDVFAFRVTTPTGPPDPRPEQIVDWVFVQVGRVNVSIAFVGAGEPFDAPEIARLTQIVVDRIPLEPRWAASSPSHRSADMGHPLSTADALSPFARPPRPSPSERRTHRHRSRPRRGGAWPGRSGRPGWRRRRTGGRSPGTRSGLPRPGPRSAVPCSRPGR